MKEYCEFFEYCKKYYAKNGMYQEFFDGGIKDCELSYAINLAMRLDEFDYDTFGREIVRDIALYLRGKINLEHKNLIQGVIK